MTEKEIKILSGVESLLRAKTISNELAERLIREIKQHTPSVGPG